MAKVILICGKICSGKTKYSTTLKNKCQAVLLSCDELERQIFHHSLTENFDEVIADVQKYLHKKAVEIVSAGSNVILDWGFWSKLNREKVSSYYKSNMIEFEWHYIDISEENWKMNINSRNEAVNSGKTTDVTVDEGLLQKMNLLFEIPDKCEIDVWYVNKGYRHNMN